MSFSTYEEIATQIENEKLEKSTIERFYRLADLEDYGVLYGHPGLTTGRMSYKQPNISNLPRTK